MRKSQKKPQGVVDAEAARDAAKQALNSARAACTEAERIYLEANSAVQAALIEADGALPQCRVVIIDWNGKLRSEYRAVILRATKSGMLVVREVGGTLERKFKYRKIHGIGGGVHEQNERRGFMRTRLELRDVPAKFIPKDQEP